MENTSSNVRHDLTQRDIYYYRHRYRERVYQSVMAYFARCAERTGVTKAQISKSLDRDPASISRWFSGPGNWTLDIVSDLLLAMDAEMSDDVVPFSEHGTISGSKSAPGTDQRVVFDDPRTSGRTEPPRSFKVVG